MNSSRKLLALLMVAALLLTVFAPASFAHLRDIQPPVDSVLLMTSPAVTDLVVRECVEAGVKRVWFYRGATPGALTTNALQMCEANGIRTVAGECPFMFLDGTPWIHRFHGLVKKITGSYPR